MKIRISNKITGVAYEIGKYQRTKSIIKFEIVPDLRVLRLNFLKKEYAKNIEEQLNKAKRNKEDEKIIDVDFCDLQ